MFRTPRRQWLIALFFIPACGTAFAQQPPPAAAATAPVTWMIFVDDLHLDFVSTGRLRDMLRTIMKELVLDGDQVAMASSGPSGVAIDPTTDRGVLTDAIKRVIGNGLKYEDILAAPTSAEVLYRASISVTTAQSLAANASRIAGAKALLYLSNGSSYSIVPDPPQTSRTIGGRRVSNRAEIEDQVAKLTATAAESGLRIFAIEPRALLPAPVPGDPGWPVHLIAQQNSLRSISDKTGGFTSVDGTLTTQLRRVAEAMQR